MTVVYVFLGILMIAGGVSCMFTPVATLLSAGYLIGILLLAYGIFGIARAVTQKGSALDWVLNILALLVGVAALVRPGSTLVLDSVIIYTVAAFFLIQGIIQVYIAIKTKVLNNNWVWNLIAGILGIIVGLYSFTHPVFTAVTVGVLIGFYFVEAGISMIAFATSGGYSGE